MNDETKKDKLLAPFAGALLIAAAVFALAAIVGFGSEGNRSDWGWGFAALSLAAFLGWFFGKDKTAHSAGDQYSRQRAILGANSVFSALLFLVLLGGVNYIAARRHKVFDLTSNRINSLSDQTHKALSRLKKPVRMTYVWSPSEMRPQIDPSAQAVLAAYQSASDNVRVETVNVLQDPLKLQSLELKTFTGQPLLLISSDVESQNKAANDAATSLPVGQEVSVVDEQNVTSALLKILDPEPRVLYFLGGHGEMSPLQTGADARLNGARAALEAQNYTLQDLALLGGESQIPADASAIVVMSPKVDLGENEVARLRKYLQGKGRLLLFFDPVFKPLPRWKSVAAAVNVQLLDGEVLEFHRDKQGRSPLEMFGELGDTTRQPLLRGVSANVIFQSVAPLMAASEEKAIIGVTPLFETSSLARSVVRERVIRERAQGPFAIAAAVERKSGNPMRAVVVGNAVFATDVAFNQFGNASFFLSAINWVVGNDALVSIPPKPPVTNSLSASDVARRFAALFSILALPLGILLLGTIVWWKRR